MRLCLSCCRARLASSCSGNARPWRVWARLSKPNSMGTCETERSNKWQNQEGLLRKKLNAKNQMVPNPCSRRRSPDSSTVLLRTRQKVQKVSPTTRTHSWISINNKRGIPAQLYPADTRGGNTHQLCSIVYSEIKRLFDSALPLLL